MDYEKIKGMTSYNNHTGARILIADELYKKTNNRRFKKIFQAIETIHEEEGFLAVDLNKYKNEISDTMLEVIRIHFGEEVYKKLNKCL